MFKFFKRKKLLSELVFQTSLLRIKQKTLKAHLLHKDWSDRLVLHAKEQITEHEESIDRILEQLRKVSDL